MLVSKCSFVLATGKGIVLSRLEGRVQRRRTGGPTVNSAAELSCNVGPVGRSVHTYVSCLVCETGPVTYLGALVRVDEILC